MLDVVGLEIRTLERRLERATSDYLAVSRAEGLFAHAAAQDQAEEEAWQRMVEAREALDAARLEHAGELASR